MHNWHLPLFAFLAFLHPIVCFSERSLVDGREQCCDRNNLLRDTRLSYGTFRFQKPSQDRRLSSKVEIHGDRRYEIRKDDSDFSRFAANRRLVDFWSEREATRNSRDVAARLIRTDYRRATLTNDRRERSLLTVEPRARFSPESRRTTSKEPRDERIQDITRQRYGTDFDTRLYERDNRDYRRMARDSINRMARNSGDEARRTALYDSRRDNQRIRERDIANEFRRVHSREARDLLQRTRADIARSEISRDRREERMGDRHAFRVRSESQVQRDTNQVHRFLEREVPDNRDARRWSLASRSADRIRDFRQETRSRLREDIRDERQRVDSRRVLTERLSNLRQSREERRESRDSSRRESHERTATIHRASRERVSEDRRSSRDSVDRVRNADNAMRLDHAASRRNTRTDEREVRLNRAASENRRLESRTIMDQETRLRENSRLNRWSSERMEIRNMKRDVRSRSMEARERDTTRFEQRMTKNNMERGDMDSRFKTSEFRRVRDIFSFMTREKAQPSEQSTVLSWQYLFYTLQGVYLCSLLIQIMSENGSKKKSR